MVTKVRTPSNNPNIAKKSACHCGEHHCPGSLGHDSGLDVFYGLPFEQKEHTSNISDEGKHGADEVG